MAQVTLAEIITRAHNMADVPEPSTLQTGAFVSATEATRVVNEGLADLHSVLVDKYEDWLTKVDAITITAGAASQDVPAEFFKLRYLFVLDGTRRVTLDPINPEDLDGYDTAERCDYPAYKIIENKIRWFPPAASTRTGEIWYIRRFTPLVNTTDQVSPELQPGWEQYPIAHLAAYIIAKEERDPSIALQAKNYALNLIVVAASNRDASRPRTTVNVSGRFQRKSRRYRY
jgi:hypothetical protein